VSPDLGVIDTLPALIEGLIHDSGSSVQWTPVMQAVTRLAHDSNAALLLLHHARKSDGGYRDSSAIGAGVDAVIEMAEVPDDPTARSFKPKARWEVIPFTLRLTDAGYVLSSGAVSAETSVLFWIQAHPGCSMRSVRDGVAGKHDEKDRALDRLLRQGLVVDQGANGVHAYHAVRPATDGGPA
jgi:hypothetical protein